MVTNITNLGRSGVSDWLIQRASAVILALYTIFMVAFFLFHPHLDYVAWSSLFDRTWMKIFTLLALLSIAAHAWIGLWIVSTDYIKKSCVRLGVQTAVILALFAFVIWGVQVLWGA
ncbi:succinate dehydrogenase, hydrophobic membrane anchor protein [Larsenimonas suaedae]|uniref:Succinate dehydrogenase hydrophobic membrane anchor subunit n=1 Tax=Larsenimonas suaedae TaxID=1851019 RepID=A0ABU1GTD1_9GAMM|nr:succinate dehydrogenase, hydrophobic membrane anchor protein [Larsenimonas suaedae]MCM2971687.1 succinate dehydrogenase, hydrophobic membrane anchor protein [Larsenimonas suaedae]MDR5895239.1 succinate dehydrogenase, hydrophobic membrane anchor protein [Larsenimonas suaedae]